MNSKESLNNIKNILREDENIWEYNEYIEQIEKDLEILEILKNYLYYDNKNHVIKMKEIRKSTFNFNYEDLKEWLENDSNKNKSVDSKS